MKITVDQDMVTFCGAILMLLASADVSRSDAVFQMPGTEQLFRLAPGDASWHWAGDCGPFSFSRDSHQPTNLWSEVKFGH